MERNRLHVRTPDVDRRRTSLISCCSSCYIRTSASFSGTNIDANYLILAWKAHEHIDFNFTVDANEHRNGYRGYRSAGHRVFRANAMPCFPMPSRTTPCTVSFASGSRHYRAVQLNGSAKRPIHPEERCSTKGRTACYNVL